MRKKTKRNGKPNEPKLSGVVGNVGGAEVRASTEIFAGCSGGMMCTMTCTDAGESFGAGRFGMRVSGNDAIDHGVVGHATVWNIPVSGSIGRVVV